jgi:hypothetical protein
MVEVPAGTGALALVASCATVSLASIVIDGHNVVVLPPLPASCAGSASITQGGVAARGVVIPAPPVGTATSGNATATFLTGAASYVTSLPAPTNPANQQAFAKAQSDYAAAATAMQAHIANAQAGNPDAVGMLGTTPLLMDTTALAIADTTLIGLNNGIVALDGTSVSSSRVDIMAPNWASLLPYGVIAICVCFELPIMVAVAVTAAATGGDAAGQIMAGTLGLALAGGAAVGGMAQSYWGDSNGDTSAPAAISSVNENGITGTAEIGHRKHTTASDEADAIANIGSIRSQVGGLLTSTRFSFDAKSQGMLQATVADLQPPDEDAGSAADAAVSPVTQP